SGILLTSSGSAEEELTAVGGDFWGITGARPSLGRLFGPTEQNSVVLSYDLFERAFGGNPKIVGQTVSLSGHAVTVTGVLEKNFELFPAAGGFPPRKRAAYIPIPLDGMAPVISPEPKPVSSTAIVSVVARLKPGVSVAQAQEEIRSLRAHDSSDKPFLPSAELRAIPYQEKIVGHIRPALVVLQAAAGLVLLIAVVNIANLLLARATTRQREIG